MEEERSVGWIDYVIVSDAKTDRALIREVLAHDWASAETSRWVRREMKAGTATPAMYDRLGQMHKVGDALQLRVCARAKELRASGALPADEATADTWHDYRAGLASPYSSEDEPEHRA